MQLGASRKQGARQLWGKGLILKRPDQHHSASWWHQARAFVGQTLGGGSPKRHVQLFAYLVLKAPLKILLDGLVKPCKPS